MSISNKLSEQTGAARKMMVVSYRSEDWNINATPHFSFFRKKPRRLSEIYAADAIYSRGFAGKLQAPGIYADVFITDMP